MSLSFESRRRQVDPNLYQNTSKTNTVTPVQTKPLTTPEINLSTLPSANTATSSMAPSPSASSFTKNYFNQLNTYSPAPMLSVRDAEQRKRREEEERKRKEEEERKRKAEKERKQAEQDRKRNQNQYQSSKKQNASFKQSEGVFNSEFLTYIDSDTKDLLDKGKAWDKKGKLSEDEKIQKQLYDYYKGWWNQTDEKKREEIFEILKEQRDRENERTIYGVNPNAKSGAAVFGEFLRGVGSGVTAGLTDTIEDDATKMQARSDQSWYSAYNLGQLGGSFLPISKGISLAKAGIQKVAPKVFKESAKDTARKKLAKRIGTELTADLIAGTAYGVAQEGIDAAFDTRGDGDQTLGERAQKVGFDALVGVGLGLGIEGVALSYSRIKNFKNNKTKRAEINRILNSPDDIKNIEDDIVKTATTIERLNKRLSALDDVDYSPAKVKAYETITSKLNEFNKKYTDLNEVAAEVNAKLTKGQNPAIKQQEQLKLEARNEYLETKSALDELKKQINSVDNPSDELLNQIVNLEEARKEAGKRYVAEFNKYNQLQNPAEQTLIKQLEDTDIQSIREQVDSEFNQSIQSRVTKEQNRKNESQIQQERQQRMNIADEIVRLQNEMKTDVTKIDGNTTRIKELRTQLNELRSLDDTFNSIPPSQRIAVNRLIREREAENAQQVAENTQQAEVQQVQNQQDYADFWANADLNNPARNENVIGNETTPDVESVTANDLPYDDVPVDRTGRIEYVIDNVGDYMGNATKKSEQVKSDAETRINELQATRDNLEKQKEDYLNNKDNINRAVAEYDQWVKLKQTINTLTKNGNGIKLAKGQKMPSVFNKGSIPIQTVADRLGVSVDELIAQMNVYQKEIPLTVRKVTTIAKKKRELAKLKLSQEQAYKDITSKLNETDELILAIEEIKPRNYEYPSKTTYEIDPDFDEQLGELFGTDNRLANVPSDNEFLSGYLIEKWYPESAEGYRNIESQIESIETKIEEQENVINEVRDQVVSERKELSMLQDNDDALARMLIDFVKASKRPIHLYRNEEQYRLRKERGKQKKTKDIPGWARGYVQLKPSRKYNVAGQRKSQGRDEFHDFVAQNSFLQETGGMEGGAAKDYGLSDVDILDNTDEILERALSGNPYANFADGYNIEGRVDDILTNQFDKNPKTIIKELQGQIDNLREQLVAYSKSVVDNRLQNIDNISDEDLVQMIRDVKGEPADFDQLLNDYFDEVYPDRVVADVEPIRLDETQTAPNQAAQKPTNTVTNELPTAPPTAPPVSQVTNNLPTQQTTTQPPVAQKDVAQAQTTQTPAPVQQANNVTETPPTTPVQTADSNAIPVEQNAIAEQNNTLNEANMRNHNRYIGQTLVDTKNFLSRNVVEPIPNSKPGNLQTIALPNGQTTLDGIDDIESLMSIEQSLAKNIERLIGNTTVKDASGIRSIQASYEDLQLVRDRRKQLEFDKKLEQSKPQTEAPVNPPVSSAPSTAPINQPNFAENLREEAPRTDMESPTGNLPKSDDEILDDLANMDLPVNESLNPTRASGLPRKPTRKERGFNETVRMSENTTDEMRTDVQVQTDINETASLVDNPNWYATKSNQTLMNQANDFIDSQGDSLDEKMRNAKSYILSQKWINAKDNAIAQIVVKYYMDNGNLGDALDVIGKVAKSGTELGQAVQAFTIWNKLDTNGILYLAQRTISKRNARIDNAYFTLDKKLDVRDIPEPIQKIANNLPKIDEVKKLSIEVKRIIESKKLGEELTDAEVATLSNFENLVKELKDELPEKPSADEVIETVEKIEPRLRQRDLFVTYMDAMAEKAKGRLNKGKNTLNANPLGTYKDMVIVMAASVAKGVVKFTDFSADAIAKFGDGVKPKLNQLYRDSVRRFRKERGLPQTTDLERVVKKSIRDKKITGEDADNLMQMATEAGFYSDEFRIEMIGDLQIALRNLEGKSFLRGLATTQTIAQLLNTKTLIRNTAGNEMFYWTEKISKMVQAPIDFTVSKMTGRAREIYFFTGNQEKYFKNWLIGAKAGWKGYAPDGITSQYDLDSQYFTHKYNPMTYLEKALGVTLRSFDYAAYKRAYGEAQASWAKGIAQAEGLTGQAMKDRMQVLMRNADDEVNSIFDEYGKYMTFQDDTLLSQLFVGGKRLLNANKEFGIGDLVLKYPKTPANLLMRAIDFSPIGITRALGEVIKAAITAKRMKTNFKDTINKRELSQSIGRSLAGLGLGAMGYYLYDAGILTSSVEKDRDLRETYKSAGVSPYQINIDALQRYVFSGFNKEKAKRQKGDLMLTYDWVQPMAVSVAIGSNVMKSEKEKQDMNLFETSFDAFDTGLTTFTEQPLVQGVTRLFTTYPNSENGIPEKLLETVQGLPSSFVPTMLNQFRTLEDNTKRITTDNTDKLNPFVNKVVDRLPSWIPLVPSSRSLPVDYDALGKPKEKYQDDSNNLFNVFFNPSFATRYNPDADAKGAIDLIEKTGDVTPAPRVPNKSLRDDTGITGKLTPTQYSQLSKIVGQKQKEYLKEYRDVLTDKSIPNDVLIEYYQKVLTAANAEARDEFKQKTNYKARK